MKLHIINYNNISYNDPSTATRFKLRFTRLYIVTDLDMLYTYAHTILKQ